MGDETQITDRPGPLAGIRVIEFASFVAGPSAGLALAQWGADVIRVDPIGGNVDLHRWPLSDRSGESLYWNALNRGKRSVTVDVRSDAGRDLLLELATAPGADAGILVDNAVGRDWLSYEALTSRRADAISVRVQGRADGGPAVDYTVNGATGIASMTGPAETDAPVNHVLPAWDLLCGQQVVSAVLAALRRRDRTGVGSLVEIALADVAFAAVADLGIYSEAAERGDRLRHGNHLYGSFGTDFVTADGERLMIVALTPRQWSAIGVATGLAGVFDSLAAALGTDFATDEGRYTHRGVIEALLTPWFAQRTAAQVRAAFDAAGVLWGPYRTPAQVATDPAAQPVLTTIVQPGTGAVISSSSPARFDGAYTGAVPARPLGADTDTVLAEVLDLDVDEIAAFRSGGVIG